MSESSLKRSRRALTPYVLLLPACILILIFIYGVITGVLQGFGIMPSLGLTTFTLDYWAQALSDSDLLASLGFSFWIAFVSALIALVLGTVLCACLCVAKATRLVQLLDLQIPIMCAHLLVVLFVVAFFSGAGLWPRVLYAFGMLDSATDFNSVVGDPSGWGIILVYAWKEIPFVAFCCFALMRNVSDTYIEAAASLGASPLRAFFTVTLPLCKGPLLKAFFIVFAFAFGAYEVPFLLGPSLPKALPVLAYIEFTSPDLLNRCFAMAINGIMVAISSLAAIGYFVVLRKEERDRA